MKKERTDRKPAAGGGAPARHGEGPRTEAPGRKPPHTAQRTGQRKRNAAGRPVRTFLVPLPLLLTVSMACVLAIVSAAMFHSPTVEDSPEQPHGLAGQAENLMLWEVGFAAAARGGLLGCPLEHQCFHSHHEHAFT